MALWVARAGRNGEQQDYALTENVVVVGWKELPDLSGISSRVELSSLLQKTYPDGKPGTLRNWEASLWAFTNLFKVGDIVALPLKFQSEVAFGRIIGPYRFVAEAPIETEHQREVEWLDTIPRSKIDSDLRYSLGGAATVFGIKRNNAEARIKAMLEGETPPPPAPSDDEDDVGNDNVDTLIDLATIATDQIIDFISRHFRGHDLAHLVAGVLRAQGYTVRVSPAGADGGVDIVAGKGPMGFDAPRLCVQVKSGDDRVDVTVLRGLRGVMKSYNADHGLIVSWGGFTKQFALEARELYFEIGFWDQASIVQAVQESYDRLDDQLQAKLPLKRTWMLLVEEG